MVTRFLYDGDELVAEYNSGGTLQRRFIHGTGAGALRQAQGDRPLVWFGGTSITGANARHLYADPRGSIVLVADSVGAAIVTNTYDEYGIPGSANAGRFQYTGQAWLPELGLRVLPRPPDAAHARYYYKAWMYSPTLGRLPAAVADY